MDVVSTHGLISQFFLIVHIVYNLCCIFCMIYHMYVSLCVNIPYICHVTSQKKTSPDKELAPERHDEPGRRSGILLGILTMVYYNSHITG